MITILMGTLAALCITLFLIIPPLVPFIVSFYGLRLRSTNHRRRAALLRDLGLSGIELESKKLIAFFHPYCDAGGGGERVLWTAIADLQRSERDIVSVVYSGDNATKSVILDNVKARFNIDLDPSSLHFVFLKSRYLVEDSFWSRFTLLGQSIGSMYLVWEALSQLIPDLYIDSMGYGFTFPIVRWLAEIPVGAYVHYPTITPEMLARVKSRKTWHTNSDTISSSSVLSKAKIIYYRFFMYYYALCLRSASFVMANSSWTRNHINAILQHQDIPLDILHVIPSPWMVFRLCMPKRLSYSARIVYPPCDTHEMAKFPLQERQRVILSVAQFRPEKDHAAQLHSFSELLKIHPEYRNVDTGVKLVLVGGSRNAEDAARVESLQLLAKQLEIEELVEFVVNASYSDVLGWLSRASIGLSTMVDEHFGINVVEFMAAGVIPVTHASGGPLDDIVVPFNGEPTGYHATTPETFAAALHTVFALGSDEELALRERARTWAVQRFSEEEFRTGWNASGWRSWLPRAAPSAPCLHSYGLEPLNL